MKHVTLQDQTVVELHHSDNHGYIWQRNAFEALSSRALTDTEVEELQDTTGYSPIGYGCFCIRRTTNSAGTHITTWSCSANCD